MRVYDEEGAKSISRLQMRWKWLAAEKDKRDKNVAPAEEAEMVDLGLDNCLFQRQAKS